MSELSATSSQSRLLSLSLHFCFSILSHPLYFSYLIFFFPYLLALLSFLFPLVVTILLILLALYTLSPPLYQDFSALSDSKVGIFSDFQNLFEEFEACKYEICGDPDDVSEEKDKEKAGNFLPRIFPPLMDNFEENKEPENPQVHEFKKMEEDEAKLGVKETPIETVANPSRTESMEDYQALGQSINGGSGSMRKEREWKRTLACKLYEERHNVEEGSEGMDLLWETYENESNRVDKNRRSSSRKCKNGGFDQEKKEEQNEEEEEEDSNGDLCCLQAFKFSAGKMNLGMGKSNFVKFSKALKGIGWFHQVKTKHVRTSSSIK